MSEGHPEYLKLLDELRELHLKKSADYGTGKDPFANCRSGAEFGVDPWVGVMIRANDKVQRIKAFLQNGNLKNESVEDSLLDLAAYTLIALVLFREEKQNKVNRSWVEAETKRQERLESLRMDGHNA